MFYVCAFCHCVLDFPGDSPECTRCLLVSVSTTILTHPPNGTLQLQLTAPPGHDSVALYQSHRFCSICHTNTGEECLEDHLKRHMSWTCTACAPGAQMNIAEYSQHLQTQCTVIQCPKCPDVRGTLQSLLQHKQRYHKIARQIARPIARQIARRDGPNEIARQIARQIARRDGPNEIARRGSLGADR